MKRLISCLALGVALAPKLLFAQLIATGPVTNGHHHFNASDPAEHMRFWVDTLGGEAGTFGDGLQIAKFPNALIFIRDQAPDGGMIGSTVNHVAFSVNDLRATVDRILDAGYEMITETEAPPGVAVVDDIGVIGGDGPVTGIAYARGPEGIKIEVLEMPAQAEPIASHHIHFFGEDAEAMRAWYIDVFGAVERPGSVNGIIGADLPGLGLSYTANAPGMSGTTGRVLDHIGFEIEDLESFTRELEAKGITLDVPYRSVPQLGLSIAFVTDPWGTSIELTEGLDEVR
ncbi:MAG: VOC family protein [Gammaproteobacteria bacterium]|jgi:catechol 2,3-dioxygenase-like lactoylglutathione lyase family enzyme